MNKGLTINKTDIKQFVSLFLILMALLLGNLESIVAIGFLCIIVAIYDIRDILRVRK